MKQLLIAIALVALSGVPGMVLPRRSRLGALVATMLGVVGAGWGLASVFSWLLGDGAPLAWTHAMPAAPAGVPLPIADMLHTGLDAISALFLVPIWLVFLCGCVYGLGYWRPEEKPESARRLRLFYGWLAAGMALLVVARHAILFLMGWELMAISAYFLVTTEDEDSEVRATGWVYFVATHVATLCLFAMFGILWSVSGQSFAFGKPLGPVATASASAIFLLALVGFGLKAGIMPLHVWLPGSHAIAPSHVSAMMSGVILKMGVYGLVRTTSLFDAPPLWWGVAVLCLGAVSALLGIAFAVAQHDMKRMMAYSSIENVGVIFLGLGLALIGRAIGRGDLVLLGLAGALLHVWNHSLFKSLLFFAAGSVMHATHTRRMDTLGGLAKPMPATSLAFLSGSLATSALPPFGGFMSELLIYVGLFSTLLSGGVTGSVAGPTWPAAALTVPVLALVGGLALACFVNAYGIVFLGAARTNRTAHAHESPRTMVWPMALLTAGSLTVGLGFPWMASWFERAAVVWSAGQGGGTVALETLLPLEKIVAAEWLLVGLVAVVGLALAWRLRRSQVDASCTWGCGYAAPTARMQYTTSGLSQMLVVLFGWALLPRRKQVRVEGYFPAGASYATEIDDPVLDDAVLPASRRLANLMSWFRWIQQGSIQAYLLYILLTLVVLLLYR